MSPPETILVPRPTLERLLRSVPIPLAVMGEWSDLMARAEEPLPWQLVNALLEVPSTDDPSRLVAAVAQLDQVQTFAAGFLAELGVDVRDLRVAYEVVAVLRLVIECARNGERSETFTLEEASAIASVVRVLGAALGRYVPDEVRR